MYDKKYNRLFFQLNEEEKGFGLNGKKPFGNCILEVRNKKGFATINIQDLSSTYDYNIYILFELNENYCAYQLHKLNLENNGKCKMNFNFTPTNISNSNFNFNDILCVLITSNNDENLTPLVGYKRGKINWKGNCTFKDIQKQSNVVDIKSNTNEKKVKEEAEILEIAEEKNIKAEEIINLDFRRKDPIRYNYDKFIFDNDAKLENKNDSKINNERVISEIILKPNNDILANEACAYEQFKENTSEAYGENIFKEFRKTIKELEDANILSKDDVSKIMGNDEKHTTKSSIQNNSEVINFINAENNYFEALFKNNKQIQPFNEETSAQFVEIPINELTFLPIDFMHLIRDIFVISSYYKYNHILLGKDNSEHILGIAAINEYQQKNRAFKLGFQSFKSCNKNLGYWIMRF